MKKSNKVGMIFFYIAFIICFLITAFATTHYIASLIKDKNELIYVEYEEHEVFSIHGESLFKKYNYSVIIKVDHDEYIVFKTDNFFEKGDTVIIKLEEYSNGDTYASIVGATCKKILIEEGTVIDHVAGN